MSTRTTNKDLQFALSKANDILERIAVSMTPENETLQAGHVQYIKDRARLDLCFAYGGVRIVRELSQDPIAKRGTKKETLDRLNVIRKTLDIVRGF